MNNQPAKICRRCDKPRLPGRTLCILCYNANRRALRHADLARINEKRVATDRIKRAARLRENRCKECGEPLDPCVDASRERCQTCRTANNAASNRQERRKRLLKGANWGMGDEPLSVGRNVSAGIVRNLTVTLDKDTFTAVDTLKHRERERRRAEATAEGITDPVQIGRRVSMIFQTSRLIRYAIKCYNRDYNHLPHRVESRPYRGKFSSTFRFGADELTLDIIEHYATERGGNLSRTIRDLLCAACFPPATVDAPT